MNKYMLSAAVALVGSLAVMGTANATLTIVSTNGGAPTGVTLDNLDALVLGTGTSVSATGITVSFTPDGGAVSGASSGIYAPPFLSGGNGLGFGSPNQPDGADTTTYVTAGGQTGSSATFALPGQELYFGLLWGSVDTFNSLEFFNGNTSVGILTGAQVGVATGDQGILGTYYVNITSDLSFNRVVASSGNQHAFEIDNLAFNPTIPTTGAPEPITLSLFGAGLAGLGFARRRKANKA